MKTEKLNCGGCTFFDLKGVDGEPFGKTQIGTIVFDAGVCRAPMGLTQGQKTETSLCTQPDGVAKPTITKQVG